MVSSSGGFYNTDIWTEVAKKYDVKNKLLNYVKRLPKEKLGKGFIIYGEVYGNGVQGEKYNYGLKDKNLAIFDTQINGEYSNHVDYSSTVRFLEIPSVEILYRGPWSKEAQDLYLYDKIPNTNVPEEGIVVKHISGERSKISKVINPDYHIYAEKQNIPDSH